MCPQTMGRRYNSQCQKSQHHNLTKKMKYIQYVTGMFSYYTQAIDSTMITALSAIATEQAKPTMNNLQQTKQCLDYAATNIEATITYHESNMILVVQSDASYFIKPKAGSRAGVSPKQWHGP